MEKNSNINFEKSIVEDSSYAGQDVNNLMENNPGNIDNNNESKYDGDNLSVLDGNVNDELIQLIQPIQPIPETEINIGDINIDPIQPIPETEINIGDKNLKTLHIKKAKEVGKMIGFRKTNTKNFMKKKENLVRMRRSEVISKIDERELSKYNKIQQKLKNLVENFKQKDETKYVAEQLENSMATIVLSIASDTITDEQIEEKINELAKILRQQDNVNSKSKNNEINNDKKQDLIKFSIDTFVNNNEILREIQDIEDNYNKLNKKYDMLYSGEANGRTKFFFRIDEDYNNNSYNDKNITGQETYNFKKANFMVLLFENIEAYFEYLNNNENDNKNAKKYLIHSIIEEQKPLMRDFLKRITNDLLNSNKDYPEDDNSELVDDIIKAFKQLEQLSYDKKVDRIKNILNNDIQDGDNVDTILKTVMSACKYIYKQKHYIPITYNSNEKEISKLRNQHQKYVDLKSKIIQNRIELEQSFEKNGITSAFRKNLKSRHNIDREKMQYAIASIIVKDGKFNDYFTEGNKGFLGWVGYGYSKIITPLSHIVSLPSFMKTLSPKEKNDKLITKLISENLDLQTVVEDYCNIIEYIQVNKNRELLKHDGTINIDIFKNEMKKLREENDPILRKIKDKYGKKEHYFAKKGLLNSICSNPRLIEKSCNNYNKKIQKDHPIMDDYAIGHNILTFMTVVKFLGGHIDTEEMNRLKQDVISVLNKHSQLLLYS